MLRLNYTIANDLNEIGSTLIEKDQPHSDMFDVVSWFKKYKRPDFTESYCNHLLVMIKHYNEKYKIQWINVDGHDVYKTPSTAYFIENNGYLNILEDEQHEEKKENLDMQQLETNVQLLTNQLSDYHKVRNDASFGKVVSIIALLLTMIGLALQWILSKTS